MEIVVNDRSRSFAQLISSPGWWLALAILGLLAGLGRYDWSADSALAFRTWALSGYFFILLLACLYALRPILALSRRALGALLTVYTVIFNLPCHWLGLDRFFYLANHPLSYGQEKVFRPEWLGSAGVRLHWTSTETLIATMFALVFLLVVAWRRVGDAGSAADSRPRFLLLLFALIAVQAWLHLSNRSPYVYITHYEQPSSEHYVSAWALLPDGRGEVNGDFAYFARLEELFLGNRADTPTMMIRRSFTAYLSAPFSYFLGPFHAAVLLNCLWWFAAAAAMAAFVRDLTDRETAGRLAAVYVACGPGFEMYVGQPMSYLSGFASVAIAVFLYHRLISRSGLRQTSAILGAGIVIGLNMLTYDTLAWILFFVGYAALKRTPLTRAFLAVALGLAIYAGYLCLIFNIFGFQPDHTNDGPIGRDLLHLIDIMRHPAFAQFAPAVRDFFGHYLSQILWVNFFVPCVLAVLALLLPQTRRFWPVASVLLLPTFASYAFLYFGDPQLYLANMPRFNYPSYVCVVFLAACAGDEIARIFRERGLKAGAVLVLAAPPAICLLLANLDAFGLLHALYFHFFYGHKGFT